MQKRTAQPPRRHRSVTVRRQTDDTLCWAGLAPGGDGTRPETAKHLGRGVLVFDLDLSQPLLTGGVVRADRQFPEPSVSESIRVDEKVDRQPHEPQ